jgi:hypothetical protein
MLDGWRKEQAALKRAIGAAAASSRGDKEWSSSVGQVPFPRSPRINDEEQEDAGVGRMGEGDGGMDIFEMLFNGPPPPPSREARR